MSSARTTPIGGLICSVRGGVALCVALLLAIATMAAVAQPAAAATPGISADLQLNGSSYDGLPVVNEGDTLTLRVQYGQAVGAGTTVEFELGDNVTLTGVPDGNSAIANVVKDGNKVAITFRDPWPAGVDQGVFDLKFTVNSVGMSAEDQITWTIDGEETAVDVIIRHTGDSFAEVTSGSTKSVTPTNLNSFVSVNAAGDTVTLNPSVAGQELTYTLRLDSADARTGFTIADDLPDGMGFVTGSFSAKLTSWNPAGLNRTVDNDFAFAPTITGNAFTGDVDVPGPSILEVTYKATVTDVAAVQAELQAALDAFRLANGTAPGNFSISLINRATFGGVEKTASVQLRGTVPGVDVGSAFGKTADWGSANVVTDEDGTLTPPADLTYTLKADLTKWTGSGPNFTLTRNVVISDILPVQATWNTGAADFITATGITLTQTPAPCPSRAAFADNAYVGHYCVDGRTLLVNVGQDTTKNVSVKAKAQVTTVTGLTQTGSTTVKDATPYRLRNTAEYDYRTGGAYQAQRDVTVVVLPDSDQGLNDSSVFTKAGTPREKVVDPGDTVTVDYTFKVSAGKGIDARTSKIVDQVDPVMFDLSDLDAVGISGTYDGQPLTTPHFELSTDPQGNLVIVLSDAGKAVVDARGADKAWQVDVALTTVPFVGKETKQIKNKATLYGEDDEPRYWSETESESTSYGDEAEVRKRVYDRSAADWVDTLQAQTDVDGDLVQDTYVYRVEFIPHGSYDNVVIVPVNDLLPDAAQFLGFVTKENAATATSPVAGPVDVGGNLVASYASDTVTIAQKSGTRLKAGNPIAAYFAVRITDASQTIVNKIGSTQAEIVPLDPPSIDIEKWTDEGTGSGPAYDVEGDLTNDGCAGDFDAAPGKGLAAGQSQQVRFTVSNDGGEALKDVVVSDSLEAGAGAIQGLSCTFPDASTGTTWAGPFQPGVQFECTGTLPGLTAGQTHHDKASVTGVGIVSEDTVDDDDDWFGFAKSYAVGDYVWIDVDRDGIQDAGELPLRDVKVELLDDHGLVVATRHTDADGRYLFDDLPGGTYQVRFTLTDQQAKIYQLTGVDAGTDDAEDSDADRATGLTAPFVLDDTNAALTDAADYDRPFNATQGVDPTWDAGVNLKSVSVGDYVWVDSDRDGRQDAGEPGIPGVVLTLVGPDGKPVTDVYGDPVGPVTTGPNGEYTFDDLPALVDGQTYTVRIDRDASAAALAPYVPTKAGVGDRGGDSSTWTASTVPGDLHGDGDRDPTLDFGFVTKSYAIGDVVWIDRNSDGIQNRNEKPLAGVKVALLDQDGRVVATTVTDKRGRYLFDDLPAGTYQVRFTLTKEQKKRYAFTGRDAGANDRRDSDAARATGLTRTIVLDDTNTELTGAYPYRQVHATQGIDPTWDAGVVERDPSTLGDVGSDVDANDALADTGNPLGWGMLAAALALLAAGGLLVGAGRRRRRLM